MKRKNSKPKNSRTKLFIENMLVYGIGSVIGKIIPFLMLPIITRMLPSTYYYGVSDMVDVMVSFGASFSVMGMYDVLFRMFFEKDEVQYKKELCSSTLFFVLFNASSLSILLILLQKPIAYILFDDASYSNLVCVAAGSIFFSALSLIFSAPTRMQNQRGKYLATNAIIPIFSYGFSIILLKAGAYEYAIPMVTLCNYLLLTVVFILLNHSFFELKLVKFTMIKDMLKLGIPLVPNFVIYWVFNSSDKLMIKYLINLEAAGVYGVGAKLGHLSQLIYTAFAGGWQYFAFSTMKDDDQVELTSNVFDYLAVLTFASSVFVTMFSKLIFSILFTEEYMDGYIIMPYMFMAPLLLMLYQTAGSQFLVVKKTWPTMFILFFGAIFNLCFNYVLIPVIGIEGAAIGTMLGYIVSVVACVAVLVKLKLFFVHRRTVKCFFSTIFFGVIWRVFTYRYDIVYLVVGCVVILYMFFLYKSDLQKILKKLILIINEEPNIKKRKEISEF